MSSSFPDVPEPFEQDQQQVTTSSTTDDVPPDTLSAPTAEVPEGTREEGADSSPSQEEQLPPEARGGTNGGPLGCCLGIVVGVLLTAMLTTGLSLALANGGVLSFATIPVLLIGTALCGYLGWHLGKRIYKEYELSPRQKRKLEQQQRRLEQMERKRKRQSFERG